MLNGWRFTKLCSLEPDSSPNPSDCGSHVTAWDVATCELWADCCNRCRNLPSFLNSKIVDIHNMQRFFGTDHSCALGWGWRYIARCKRWNFGCTAPYFYWCGVSPKFKGKEDVQNCPIWPFLSFLSGVHTPIHVVVVSLRSLGPHPVLFLGCCLRGRLRKPRNSQSKPAAPCTASCVAGRLPFAMHRKVDQWKMLSSVLSSMLHAIKVA